MDNQASAVASSDGGELDVPYACYTEFTVFPKLPPELRDKIWMHAIPAGKENCLPFWPFLP